MNDALDIIFRAYDVRGIAGRELTPEFMMNAGQAFGTLLQEHHETTAVVARDGRESSPELCSALIQGISHSGCDVIDLGLTCTPVLYFATRMLNHHSGVMLTGSHNAREYNGLKMILKQKSLSTEQLIDLKHRVRSRIFSEGNGDILPLDIMERYIHHALSRIRFRKKLKVVVDASNGAASELAPKLLHEAGMNVIPLYCEADGRFPHHDPDSSQPENYAALIEAVRANQADLGVMFDGDADRLGAVTESGRIIWPDRLLMLFAQHILEKTPKAKIIYDVKCSEQLHDIIHGMGGQPMMWKTGHVHIKNKLLESRGMLAGEMSGHFFFHDRWFGFDDGPYAALRLLEILSEHEHSFDELVDQWPMHVNTPELRIRVEEHEKFPLMDALIERIPFETSAVNTLDGARVTFDGGWGLLRPSNTSPYLILRFEAETEAILKRIQDEFKTWICSVRAGLSIPF